MRKEQTQTVPLTLSGVHAVLRQGFQKSQAGTGCFKRRVTDNSEDASGVLYCIVPYCKANRSTYMAGDNDASTPSYHDLSKPENGPYGVPDGLLRHCYVAPS